MMREAYEAYEFSQVWGGPEQPKQFKQARLSNIQQLGLINYISHCIYDILIRPLIRIYGKKVLRKFQKQNLKSLLMVIGTTKLCKLKKILRYHNVWYNIILFYSIRWSLD